MIQFEESVEINRPAAQVFDVLCKFESYPAWIKPVKSARQTTPGPLAVGSRMSERAEAGIMRGEIEWEITAFEPGRLIEFLSELSWRRMRVVFVVTPRMDGTSVNEQVTLEMRSVLRIGEPIMAGRLRSARIDMLAGMKQFLEERPAFAQDGDRETVEAS